MCKKILAHGLTENHFCDECKDKIKQRNRIKTTKKKYVFDQLSSMNVGDEFNKKEFITLLWKDHDYFLERSFDVFYCQARKQLSDRKFKTIKGHVKRIS